MIIAVTESHQKSLLQSLQDRGAGIASAIEQGRCLLLDVADTLSTFMVNDLPDPMRFFEVVGDLIATAQATAGGPSRRYHLRGMRVNLVGGGQRGCGYSGGATLQPAN